MTDSKLMENITPRIRVRVQAAGEQPAIGFRVMPPRRESKTREGRTKRPVRVGEQDADFFSMLVFNVVRDQTLRRIRSKNLFPSFQIDHYGLHHALPE